MDDLNRSPTRRSGPGRPSANGDARRTAGVRRHRGFVAVLVGVVLLFAGATATLGVRTVEEKRTTFSLMRSGAWDAAQLELEQQRLLTAVSRYRAQPSEANRQAVDLRFDILWSRFPNLLETDLGRAVLGSGAVAGGIAEAFAGLPALERKLADLDPARPDTFAAVRTHLDADIAASQALMRRVLQEDPFDGRVSGVALLDRELVLAFLVTLLSGLLLIALLVRQVRVARRFAGQVDEARADAEAARRRLQEAIESLSEGFLLLDADLRVVLVNRRYYDLLPPACRDFAPGDCFVPVVQRAARIGLYGEGRTPEASAAWRLDRLRRPGETLALVNPDGTRVLVREYRTADGGLVSMRMDVSELHRAQQERLSLQAQVFRAQKMEALGRMAGGIAHDFNSILMAIEGYAGFLHADLPESGEQREYAARILSATARASGLVRQILDYTRPGAGGRRAVRLDALVEEGLALLRAAGPPGIRLAVHAPSEALRVEGDPDRLAQVVANVAVNACDAIAGRGGTVRISLETRVTDGGRADRLAAAAGGGAQAPMTTQASTDGVNRLWLGVLPPARYHVVEVADDGTGMDLAVLERMFDPFFTTKDQAEATGLGLAAAQGIVLAHGGGFFVETAPGRGTRVQILLPAAAAQSDDLSTGSEGRQAERPGGRCAA